MDHSFKTMPDDTVATIDSAAARAEHEAAMIAGLASHCRRATRIERQSEGGSDWR